MLLILAVIVFLLILYIYYSRKENYDSCGGCRGGDLNPSGVHMLNPFLPPYSAQACVDDLYIIENDTGVKLDQVGPLTHLNAPDHVVLTN